MGCISCAGNTNATFVIKRGDLDPAFRAQIMSATDAASLAAASSARFILRNTRTAQLLISNIMTIEDQILYPGIVSYQWNLGDTDIPGFYLAEIEIYWDDDQPQTFPTECQLRVVVTRDLDSADLVVAGDDYSPPGQQVWEGHGPPEDDIPGSNPGDQYLDLDTGDIYELE